MEAGQQYTAQGLFERILLPHCFFIQRHKQVRGILRLPDILHRFNIGVGLLACGMVVLISLVWSKRYLPLIGIRQYHIGLIRQQSPASVINGYFILLPHCFAGW